MKHIDWNPEKNEWLKKHRGVCFEQIALILERDEALAVIAHPNPEKYPNQNILIAEIDRYAYLVPYVVTGENFFLKTIIPSRKATAQYLR